MSGSRRPAANGRPGIRDYPFGTPPRVHVSCDFRRELAFYDAVRTELSVSEVGRSSVRYALPLTREDDDGTGVTTRKRPP